MTTPQRRADLLSSVSQIQSRIQRASAASNHPITLVAVSKYKPPSDILALYDHGHRDFGENYVQELVDKAKQLPLDLRWHFIGTLQSNKAKTLAAIPNLHTIQTLTSSKSALLLNNALPSDRPTPLNVLLQINTSSEASKSGLPPLSLPPIDAEVPTPTPMDAELPRLAKYIITQCPKLRLTGLMTIGSLSNSLSPQAGDEENEDFATLRTTRDVLQRILEEDEDVVGEWGVGGKLVLSMGMSGDFECAVKAGSDVVRVGTGIFGERDKKGEGSAGG